jgi:hypothetical protein
MNEFGRLEYQEFGGNELYWVGWRDLYEAYKAIEVLNQWIAEEKAEDRFRGYADNKDSRPAKKRASKGVRPASGRIRKATKRKSRS